MQYRTPTHHAAATATKTALAALMLATLAACGGGGGDAGSAASAGGSAGNASGGSLSSTPSASTGSPGATPTAAQLQRSDFQVNTTAAGDQDSAVVARLADGGYVAVWTSDAVSANSNIRLQRYDAQLHPVGTETPVAAGSLPGVTALANGGFVLTWTASPYTYETNGYAQVFDAQGQPAAGPIQLAATFYKYVARPTALPDGSFVVAVDTVAGKYGAAYGTLTRYAANGSVLGTPVRLTSSLDAVTGAIDTNSVADVTATALPDGRFVAAWIASGRTQSELRLALFDAQGVQLGGFTTLANEPGLRAPSLATLADGSYVVAWQSGAADGAKTAHAEMFTPAGVSLGRQVLATDAGASVLQPKVAATADGGFVAAWRLARYGASALERQVLAQRFGASGTAAAGAETIGQVSVPMAGRSNFNDSLAVAGTAGSGYLVLHGAFAEATGWEVQGASR